jgi:hypothetical protein
MILTPAPLQRPAPTGAVMRPVRGPAPVLRQPAAALHRALQPVRTPQQLSLDLQPRAR